MENLIVFFEMGGYGMYVWSSFFIALGLLICLTLISLRSLKRAQMMLAQLQETMSTARNEA